MICALFSGASNLALLYPENSYWSIATLRFITGICLAGIYPIGIKIASDYFKNGLGRALGFLVGTLVLGTAIPHFFNLSLRKASFGYFGHMWELYTLWAFVPLLLTTYNQINHTNLSISLWSFIIIVSGVAKLSLWVSLSCILLFPLALSLSPYLFLIFMVIWGMFVIADSPQLSTLVAQSAPLAYKGTAITLVNSLGFLLTIFSIQLINTYAHHLSSYTPFIILAMGPALGLFFLNKKN